MVMWAPGPWSVQLAWVILTVTEVSYTLRYLATREISVLRPEGGQGMGGVSNFPALYVSHWHFQVVSLLFLLFLHEWSLVPCCNGWGLSFSHLDICWVAGTRLDCACIWQPREPAETWGFTVPLWLFIWPYLFEFCLLSLTCRFKVFLFLFILVLGVLASLFVSASGSNVFLLWLHWHEC